MLGDSLKPYPSAASLEVTVLPNGDLVFLWDDRLQRLLDLGSAEIRRVGSVEPLGVEWVADLSAVGGPRLGPFRLRDEALRAEVEWLRRNGRRIEGLTRVASREERARDW